MARMLYLKDSADLMLNITRRHQRLCRKMQNTQTLINAIQPSADALKNKASLQEQAKNDRQDAHDDVLFLDSDLDNSVRDVNDACEGYDRAHAGANMVKTIFPNGNFSEIIRMPVDKEPNEVDKLAVKLESLGSSHALFPMAAKLRTSIDKVRQGLDSVAETIRLENAAKAETEIAKLNIIRAYEANYLDARKSLGAKQADRLFPVVARPSTETEEDKS